MAYVLGPWPLAVRRQALQPVLLKRPGEPTGTRPRTFRDMREAFTQGQGAAAISAGDVIVQKPMGLSPAASHVRGCCYALGRENDLSASSVGINWKKV